jgi:hypothetical protein
MTTKAGATTEDLYGLPEDAKAEIVDGRVVLMSPKNDEMAQKGCPFCAISQGDVDAHSAREISVRLLILQQADIA